MTNYIILLPPSESKVSGGEESKIYRLVKNLKQHNKFIDLELDREYIYKTVVEAISLSQEDELEKVFELKGDNLKNAVENHLDLLNKLCLKSIDRYEGVMFKAIQYNYFDEIQKNNFNNSVIFIDGMFGMLSPTDFIPNYKLKVSSKLENLNIQKYWKERLAPFLQIELKDKIVIDLLPEAHRKIVDYSSAKEVYKITFSEIKGGKVKNLAHFSKLYKGEFIKEIVKNNDLTKSSLLNFKHSAGHSFSKQYSKGNEIVFLKK